MTLLNKRLVRKGKGVPTHALVQQAETTLVHTRANQEPLVESGLPPEKIAGMPDCIAAVKTRAGARKEKRDVAAAQARKEVQARQRAKSFKRRLIQAAKLALSEDEEEDVLLKNLGTGPVGSSTGKLVTYLDEVKPHVVTLEERIKPFFRQKSAVTELDQVRAGLEAADATQESSLDTAPAETQQLYEDKGRLLELIEFINGVARIAFDGQADKLALFNKDLLLRAKHQRGEKGETDSEEPDTEETEIEAATG